MADTRKATSFKHGKWTVSEGDVMEELELRDAGFPPRLFGKWRVAAEQAGQL